MSIKTNLGITCLAFSLGCTSVQGEVPKKVDVLLIGGGIMSSTLAVWLNELEPQWSLEMVERLDGVAEQSSNGWNNAGTGHNENPDKLQEVWVSTSRTLQLATAEDDVDAEETGPTDLQPIDQSQETERDQDPELAP